MLTAAGIDFGVALDRGALGLMETGSSENMQNYNYFSELLLEHQKSEDNFVKVMVIGWNPRY